MLPKIILSCLLFFCTFGDINAQESDGIISTPFIQKTYPPQFVDGESAFLKYVKNNIHYPTSALIDGWEGTAIVHFVIEDDGSPANVSIKNKQKVPINIQRKLITFFTNMQRWKPCCASGRSYNLGYEIPITFKIVAE